MTTYIAHRTDVVLSAVQPAWLTTSDIDSSLRDAGHRWTNETTRETLKYLASTGKIESRRVGNGYQWRTVPTPEPVAARHALDLLTADAILDELRDVIERSQHPAPEGIYIPDDADLVDLLHIDEQLASCIVKRAAYDALKGMRIVLDGWIEGARENASMGVGTDVDAEQFHAIDIRRMINDACRLMGTREVCTDAAS